MKINLSTVSFKDKFKLYLAILLPRNLKNQRYNKNKIQTMNLKNLVAFLLKIMYLNVKKTKMCLSTNKILYINNSLHNRTK